MECQSGLGMVWGVLGHRDDTTKALPSGSSQLNKEETETDHFNVDMFVIFLSQVLREVFINTCPLPSTGEGKG